MKFVQVLVYLLLLGTVSADELPTAVRVNRWVLEDAVDVNEKKIKANGLTPASPVDHWAEVGIVENTEDIRRKLNEKHEAVVMWATDVEFPLDDAVKYLRQRCEKRNKRYQVYVQIPMEDQKGRADRLAEIKRAAAACRGDERCYGFILSVNGRIRVYGKNPTDVEEYFFKTAKEIADAK